MKTLDFRKMITSEISSPTSADFQRNAQQAVRPWAIFGHPALFLFASDVLSFIISFCISFCAVHFMSAEFQRLLHPTGISIPSPHLLMGPSVDQITLFVLMALLFARQGHYRGQDSFWDETRIVTLSALGAFLIAGAFAWRRHASPYDLPMIGGLLALFALLAPIARQATRHLLHRGRIIQPGPRSPRHIGIDTFPGRPGAAPVRT
ncbi:hypothetical protein HLH34_08850 [Gluconacetobacter azotocaptans]|uniref:Uncharacterized protein n=1 Tax=Gluconacetobacter azotocaptans TaxID=142834 RepID=A0A7W4JSG1_9PROT|nr:hypothetical protein [Gluconacetobacter azotocaptans]MBB2190076.1 hypothetical protein [Gluconacetobacter azotocaptans]